MTLLDEYINGGGGSCDYATTSNASAVITADCENPELAAKFLNYCYSQAGHDMINYGKEGEAYTLVDGVPVYTDEIMHNPNGWSVSTAMTYYGLANRWKQTLHIVLPCIMPTVIIMLIMCPGQVMSVGDEKINPAF